MPIKQPKEFTKKPESRREKIESRKLKHAKRVFTASLYFLALIGIISIGLAGYSFFSTHGIQSPFRSPFYLKKVKILSPIGKKKVSLIDQAYASESAQITQPSVKFAYESLVFDIGQKEVKQKVENTLGKAYAQLIFEESGFHPTSVNSIGACGLGQDLPCSKLPCELVDIDCQLTWIRNYVERRYGTIEVALAFHEAHNYY